MNSSFSPPPTARNPAPPTWSAAVPCARRYARVAVWPRPFRPSPTEVVPSTEGAAEGHSSFSPPPTARNPAPPTWSAAVPCARRYARVAVWPRPFRPSPTEVVPSTEGAAEGHSSFSPPPTARNPAPPTVGGGCMRASLRLARGAGRRSCLLDLGHVAPRIPFFSELLRNTL